MFLSPPDDTQLRYPFEAKYVHNSMKNMNADLKLLSSGRHYLSINTTKSWFPVAPPQDQVLIPILKTLEMILCYQYLNIRAVWVFLFILRYDSNSMSYI